MLLARQRSQTLLAYCLAMAATPSAREDLHVGCQLPLIHPKSFAQEALMEARLFSRPAFSCSSVSPGTPCDWSSSTCFKFFLRSRMACFMAVPTAIALEAA